MPQAKPKKHLPEKAPKRTGKRGIGPKPDGEAPQSTAAAEEQELLKTPANAAKRGPKQRRLPTMEDPEIEELEEAAEHYAGVRDDRMALTKKEVDLQSVLLTLMKRHDKTTYFHDGFDIKLIVEKEKVRVKIRKEKD